MEKIKTIKKLKNNRYQLLTESGRKVSLSEDTLVRHRLLKGEELTEKKLTEIEKEAEMDIGYQLALNYLNFQLRSEKEIKDHLRKKEISSEGISYVLSRLKELALIDDLIFAQSYVRTAMRTSDKGPSNVRQYLMKKGISQEVLEEAMTLFDETKQTELAQKIAEKSVRKYHNKSHSEKRNKVSQHLYTKGFSSDVVKEVMSELVIEKDEEAENDLLAKEGNKLWRRHQKREPYERNQKVIQSLYQKGFNGDDIHNFIANKEMENDD